MKDEVLEQRVKNLQVLRALIGSSKKYSAASYTPLPPMVYEDCMAHIRRDLMRSAYESFMNILVKYLKLPLKTDPSQPTS